MAGLEQYNGKQKENWRGWMWNQIVNRLDVLRTPRGESFGFYLCGPDDLDGKLATNKGIRRENLIALDIDSKCINRCRKQGAIAVCEDAFQVAKQWDSNCDFIALDMLGGWTEKSGMRLFELKTCKSIKANCIVAVNLQRGHDKILYARNRINVQPFRFNRKRLRFDSQPLETVGKHRGMQAAFSLIVDLTNVMLELGVNSRRIDMFRMLWGISRPSFFSYPSRKNGVTNIYDSMVMFWPLNSFADVFDEFDVLTGLEKSTSRKLAAMKAIRTIRKKRSSK